jgi:hypothetical protein
VFQVSKSRRRSMGRIECQGLTGPCAQREQVWFSKVLTKQDLIKVEIKPRRIVVQMDQFNKSLLRIRILQIELSPFQHARVARS